MSESKSAKRVRRKGNSFRGGVYDGRSIWLVPSGSSDPVKINCATGAKTSYTGKKWIVPGVLHPWDRERRRVLTRLNPFKKPQKLDRDVNYFVLQMERLGCKTIWSCGGHPDDFYIVFRAPYPVAFKVALCGYLRVGVDFYRNQFYLSRNFKTSEHRPNTPKPKFLRWAAVAWEKYLGPLRKRKQ